MSGRRETERQIPNTKIPNTLTRLFGVFAYYIICILFESQISPYLPRRAALITAYMPYMKKSGDAQSSHFSTTIDESTASPLGGY